MATFRLSAAAKRDLLDISVYTIQRWSEAQATRYVLDLKACCQMIADRPNLGRACDHILEGLRCMPRRRHVIFYLPEAGGILVARILHDRMLPEKHGIDEAIEGPEAEAAKD